MSRGAQLIRQRVEGAGQRVTWAAQRLDEGAQAGDGLADDQRVHLARALVGVDRLGVGHEAPDMVLEQDAVAAEQLARIADGLAAFDRAERLRQRRMLVLHQSLVLQLRQPQHHRLGRGDVAEHAHQQILDELEAADRPAELYPLGARSAAHARRRPSGSPPRTTPPRCASSSGPWP